MNTRTIPILLALLTVASAQPPEGGRPPHRPPPVMVLDRDHDGVISAEEIAAAADTLAKLDSNGDGQLTMEELRPPRPPKADRPEGGQPPGKPPRPPVIEVLDADHDGQLSANELQTAPTSLKQLDMNGDGVISPKELHPHGPPPPPQDD